MNFSTLKDGEDVSDCPSFSQLSEIDKLLYEAIKSTCIENNEVPMKKKKSKSFQQNQHKWIILAKSEKPIESDNYSLAESPAAISNDGLLSIDNNQCTANMDALNFDDLKFESIFENNTDDLKSSLVQMVKTQTETLEVSFRHFRKEIVVGKSGNTS